jgi:hypothetical protein
MASKPVFAGLIVDENDQPVSMAYVGGESFYVVNDAGFHRHIPTEEVDRQVLSVMYEQVKGHEDIISEQTAKMMGQNDLFTMAILKNQLAHLDQQLEALLKNGIPEEGRAYLGMMGFRVVINVHGELVRVDQPTQIDGEEGDE